MKSPEGNGSPRLAHSVTEESDYVRFRSVEQPATAIAQIVTCGRTGGHQVLTRTEHPRGIPLGSNGRGSKILVRLVETAPAVERPAARRVKAAMAGGLR